MVHLSRPARPCGDDVIGQVDDETGFGDPIIRFPMIWDSFKLGKLAATPVFIQEFTLPFGSSDLSGDTFIVSPGAGLVIANPMNPRWFVALIQFYDFDADKGSKGSDVNRIRLRYFYQYMLSLKQRIYLMPEFQASFDLENGENSFWFAPEIGKVVRPGMGNKPSFVVYGKPGVGIDNQSNSGDREWSLEVGFRLMWDKFPLGTS